jgi:hypothetical protein
MLLKQPFSQVPPQAIAVSPVRYFRIAPETHIRRIGGPHSSAVEHELLQARIAWKKYQSTRRRDAIYDYLRAAFKIVRRWRKEHRAKASSHQALRATGRANRIRNVEPFAVVILVSSDPRKEDAKTRSKWSRLLRYADQFKPDTERLADFVKSQGGINECAAQWSDQVTRTGEKVDQ